MILARSIRRMSVALAATVWCAATIGAQSSTVKEYQLKAVFLFNFAQFVDWPPAAFPDSGAPLAICVLGKDPFGTFLDETVRGERINSRPLVVQRLRFVEEADTCHILFVS